MKHQAIIHELIVGGLGGLSVVVIYIVIQAASHDTNPGDWLAFAGSMLGTGGAVAGAIFVENYKDTQEKREGIHAFHELLVEIEAALRDCAENYKIQCKLNIGDIIEKRNRLKHSQDLYKFIVKRYKLPDILTWRRIREVLDMIEKMQNITYSYYEREINEHLCSQETVGQGHKEIQKLAKATLPMVNIALVDISKSKWFIKPAL